MLPGNGWDPLGLADPVSPGEALDLLDKKPILAQPRDRPVLLITKYHL